FFRMPRRSRHCSPGLFTDFDRHPHLSEAVTQITERHADVAKENFASLVEGPGTEPPVFVMHTFSRKNPFGVYPDHATFLQKSGTVVGSAAMSDGKPHHDRDVSALFGKLQQTLFRLLKEGGTEKLILAAVAGDAEF